MDIVRWGIIGCGNVTRVKSGPAFQKATGSVLVAVMRRNRDLAADCAKRHGGVRWYDDGQALIEDPEVDAVYIATPPGSHKQYTMMAAAAGKPVYCEKPMGLNPVESAEMLSVCRAAGVPLFCAYYRRALPKYVMVKQMVDEGLIGSLRFVNAVMHQAYKTEDGHAGSSWRVKPEVSGGGRFFDVAPHQLDLIEWYAGPAVSAHGQSANQAGLYEAEDVVSGSWVTDRGVHVAAAWSFATYKDDDRLELYGEKGKISFAVLDVAAPLVVEDCTGVKTLNVPPAPPHVAQPYIQTVVDELLGRGTCPGTAESAVRTDRLMVDLTGR